MAFISRFSWNLGEKEPSPILDENSWDVISKVAKEGMGEDYWQVGDTKKIHVEGQIGNDFDINDDLYVYILEFDHNVSFEGSGITFGCFKNNDNQTIGLTDSYYNTTNSTGELLFNMNHWGSSSSPYNTNYGGWAGCDLRYDILGSTNVSPNGYGATPIEGQRKGNNPTGTCTTDPTPNTLMAALPQDLRNVMIDFTIYTDSVGQYSTSNVNVTASNEFLPLLAEYEIHGSKTYANEYEQNYQEQYKYFLIGNSKIYYNYTNNNIAITWWTRSPSASSKYSFCSVETDGSAISGGGNEASGSGGGRFSLGLAPIFRVGNGSGKVDKITIPYPTLVDTELIYTGNSLSPTWSGYDSSMMTLTGITSTINAGTYTAVFTPIGLYIWEDGTQSPYEITWSIGRATISATPTQSGTLTYTGSSLSPSWSNYDSSQLTLSGTTSGTNAGSYTATFTPTSNYQWSDGSTSSKSVTWTIGRATISTTPSQFGSLTYTGKSQSPSWNNYNSSQLTIGGTTSATNAGSYTATFTPTSNYQWSGGSTSSESVTWTIDKKEIYWPEQSGTLTYNGSSQSPKWDSDYDSSLMYASGTTSATNAGTYSVTWYLYDTTNYKWKNTTASGYTVTWTIGKMTPTISLSMTLNGCIPGYTYTGTVSYNGDGTLSVSISSSTSNLGSASINGSTVTFNAQNSGTGTLTVTASSTTNCYSVSASTQIISGY